MNQRAQLSGADHSVMREVNRSLVLDLIRADGPTSRAEIAKTTSLAKPTVSAIVDELVAGDLVREIGPGRTKAGGGRPPILLEFNERSQFVVGVHVGVQRTNVVVTDARGTELGRVSKRTPAGRPRTALKRIARVAEAAVEEAGAARSRLTTVGVCVPGLVHPTDGVCLLAPNLGWKDVAVGELLSEELGTPVFVHNTAQAAAVAEAVEGAGRGSRELILLYAGTGVGAGILTEGRLYHGSAGIAGEIGHCTLPGATQQCSCGKIGCVEAIASAPAIVRAAQRAITDGRSTVLPGGFDAKDVAGAAEMGDDLAREALASAGEVLGTAASWLVNVFNPEVLVVGGGLAGAGDALLGPLRETLLSHALPQAAARLEIRTWALGQDAKVRGAVLVALQYAETYYRVIFQG